MKTYVALALAVAFMVAAPAAASAKPIAPQCRAAAEQAGFGKVTSVDKLGKTADGEIFHAHMEKKGKRMLFITGDGDCTTYPIGRATAGSYGTFDGGDRLRVFLAPPADCEFDACPAAVIIRDDKKNFLYASRTSAACEPAEVKTIDLFAGRQSFAVSCSAPVGGLDTMHNTEIFSVVGKSLVPVARFIKGMSEATEEDGKTCRRPAPGSYAIKKKGKAPVIEAFDVEDGDEPKGALVTLTWNPKKKVFDKTASKPHAVPAPAVVCK